MSPLPPTTNVLSSEQRTRLVRSARKLGSVLGTTPCLLDGDAVCTVLPIGKTTSRALKRQGSIFTHHHTSSLSLTSSISTVSSHHPSSSTSSLEPGAQTTELLPATPPGLSTRRRHKPPPLHLRINPVPVSPLDNRVPLPHSPISSSPPSTPVTPSVPDLAEARRKRLAKLTRHLGEHVPAELVFPLDPAPKVPSKCSRRRSQSVHILHTQAAHVADEKPSRQTDPEWVGEWNRSSIRDVQKELRNLRLR